MSARLNCIALGIGVCFASSADASSFAVIAQPKTSPSIITLGVPAKASTPPVSDAAAAAPGNIELPPLTYASQAPPALGGGKPSYSSGALVSASIIALGEPGVENVKVAAVPKKHQDAIPFVMRGGIWGDLSANPIAEAEATTDDKSETGPGKAHHDDNSQASASDGQDASSSPESQPPAAPQSPRPVSGPPPGGLVPIR